MRFPIDKNRLFKVNSGCNPQLSEAIMTDIATKDPRLYNSDLAPTPDDKKTWGWFEIFNVWANDVQSLFGYTLAASLFLTYGLNG